MSLSSENPPDHVHGCSTHIAVWFSTSPQPSRKRPRQAIQFYVWITLHTEQVAYTQLSLMSAHNNYSILHHDGFYYKT